MHDFFAFFLQEIGALEFGVVVGGEALAVLRELHALAGEGLEDRAAGVG